MWRKEILMFVSRMPEKLVTTPKSFSEGIGLSLVQEMKKNGAEPATTSQKENGTSNPIKMIEVFAQSGHPVFRGTSTLSRGTWKRKQGRNTIHFTADSGNIELIRRTIRSASQLSIYGGVSSW